MLIRRGQDSALSWKAPWLHFSSTLPWQGPWSQDPSSPAPQLRSKGWQAGLEAAGHRTTLSRCYIRRGQDSALSWRASWLHFNSTLPLPGPWSQDPSSPAPQIRSVAGRQAWRPRVTGQGELLGCTSAVPSLGKALGARTHPAQLPKLTKVKGLADRLGSRGSQDKAQFLIPVLIRRGQDSALSWRASWLHFNSTLSWPGPWSQDPSSPAPQLRSMAG